MTTSNPKLKRKGARPAENAEDAYGYALWYLNKFGDTSESNLRIKLRNKTDNQEWIDYAINKLIDQGYQSDQRYAEILVRRGMETKSWGRSRIQQELARKGIPRDIMAEAMQPLDDDDPVARATVALSKKFRGREIDSEKDSAKATRFLVTRGFDFDSISKAIRQHNESLGNDEFFL